MAEGLPIPMVHRSCVAWPAGAYVLYVLTLTTDLRSGEVTLLQHDFSPHASMMRHVECSA